MTDNRSVEPPDGSTHMVELDTSALADARTALVVAPTGSAAARETCRTLVDVVPPAERAELAVRYHGDGPAASHGRRRGNPMPAAQGLVHVGETVRSRAADAGRSGPVGGPLAVETVSDPRDLTETGIAVSRILEDWAGRDARVVCCFDSVTALLDAAALRRAFRFLHVLVGRLAKVEARAHFHFDPSGHDAQTVNVLAQLFDAIVDVDADGSVSVRTR